MSGGPKHQLDWLKSFESKHTMMEASIDIGKSQVMLNRKIIWQSDGIAYIPDKIHFERELSKH